MPKNMWKYLYLAARLTLGGVFIYASLDKIAHPGLFAEAIYNYKILPTELINLSAVVLPYVELLCGVLLVLGRPALPSAAVLTALVLVFLAAIGYNLARGLDFTCGCFTTSPEAGRGGWETLLRDAALLIPAALCLYEGMKRTKKATA
ncbi:MAG: MauE/DoxX family redox-associated membrane protein [Thermodesulfobacteriota bacterium]